MASGTLDGQLIPGVKGGKEDRNSHIIRALAPIDIVKVVQLDRWSRLPLVSPQGDATTARQWADSLGIGYLPALVFFDKGQEVIRAESLFKSFHLQSMMDYVLSGVYRSQPEFQRYVHQRADRLREQGIAVDLWD